LQIDAPEGLQGRLAAARGRATATKNFAENREKHKAAMGEEKEKAGKARKGKEAKNDYTLRAGEALPIVSVSGRDRELHLVGLEPRAFWAPWSPTL